MRLLFLTDNFPPEINAPANRTYEHCKEWVANGVEVTVITCVPNFPIGKVFGGYRNRLYQREQIDGIKVIRVWSYITANEGFFKRILDYISYAFMAFWVGLFVKTDLIIATSPQFFTAVSGAALAFCKRKKWIMEVRDLWPESILAVGAMKRNLFIRLLEWLEKQLYLYADHIIVVTDTFKEKIGQRGIDEGKISVFKNGANLDFYKPSTKPDYLLEKLGLENKFVVAYIGTHGMAHGLKFVLSAVNKIKSTHPEYAFLFIGDGAEKKELKEFAGELDLTNVLFLDSVPKDLIVDYLNLIDVSLVNLRRNDTFLTVIPSKLFEAAAMGKPVLLGLEGETKKIVEKYNAGLCFVPENETSFISALHRIGSEKDAYNVYKQGCFRLASDFSRSVIASAMLAKIKDI
jgi:glycosyltransferase involved in cell wall biosynthesis